MLDVQYEELLFMLIYKHVYIILYNNPYSMYMLNMLYSWSLIITYIYTVLHNDILLNTNITIPGICQFSGGI